MGGVDISIDLHRPSPEERHIAPETEIVDGSDQL
jgi:hypothetical protein